VADPIQHRVRGKVILFGEHAVVYGAPALAVPVPRGLCLTLTAGEGAPRFVASRWDLDLRLGEGTAATERLEAALERAFELCPGAAREVVLSVDSDIPSSAGLGSSAALAVSLVRTLAEAAGETVSSDEELRRAMEIETVFHGKPSGIDHSTVALDRPLIFIKDQPPATRVPLAKPFSFVVGVVGSHGETAQRVEGIARRRSALPQLHAEIFESIAGIANRALKALGEGQPEILGDLMDINQGLLNALGVSSPQIEQAVFAAREAGALGAKLSGAGGGGAVLALCAQETSAVERAFTELGWESFVTRLVPDQAGNAEVP